MKHPYVIRIPLQLPRRLMPSEQSALEQSIKLTLEDWYTPLPIDTIVQCVEVLPTCPCCDEWEGCCDCRFKGSAPRYCLEHERNVPEED